jgi:hypothetical protein
MIIISKSAKALRTSISLALLFFISFQYIILIYLSGQKKEGKKIDFFLLYTLRR